jgi:hypothetical protein
MRQTLRLAVMVPVGAAIAIVGGIQLLPTSAASPEAARDPARLVKVPGTDRTQVVLDRTAATRLDVHTVAVAPGASGGSNKVIPYAALLYDAVGRTFTYVRVKPLTFERTSIDVASVEGERVLVSSGLPAGVRVVTVGAAELIGIESGVDEE